MGSTTSRENQRVRKPEKREAAVINPSDKVKLQLKLQRDNLSAAIRRYERVGEVEHEKAKELLKAGDKRRALYCLKREKQQQAQISTVSGMLDNVQRLLDTIELQTVEAEVFGALKSGKTELEKLNKMLNIEDVEKLMNETAESVEEAKEIDALLRQPIAGVEDDDELLDELNNAIGVTEPNELDDVKVPQHQVKIPVSMKPKEEDSEKEEDNKRPMLQGA